MTQSEIPLRFVFAAPGAVAIDVACYYAPHLRAWLRSAASSLLRWLTPLAVLVFAVLAICYAAVVWGLRDFGWTSRDTAMLAAGWRRFERACVWVFLALSLPIALVGLTVVWTMEAWEQANENALRRMQAAAPLPQAIPWPLEICPVLGVPVAVPVLCVEDVFIPPPLTLEAPERRSERLERPLDLGASIERLKRRPWALA